MLIAYVAGRSMKHDQRISVWSRFDCEYCAKDWIDVTYDRLVKEDRTMCGLLTYGILRPEEEMPCGTL